MENRRTGAGLQGAGQPQGQNPGQNQVNLSGQSFQQNQQPNAPNNLSNIAKINARLRARNPQVVNSLAATSPQMLLPLSQRTLSPNSHQVIPPPTQQQTQSLSSGVNRPHSYTLNLNIGSMNQQKQNPPSRDPNNQRKLLHKSFNSVNTGSAGHSPENEINQSKPLSSQGINMSVQMLQQRRQQSLEFPQKQGPLSDMNVKEKQDLNNSVSLNSKIQPNNRGKRNQRDRSYDLYSQKIQLPPMVQKPETGAGFATNRQPASTKNDRTYSLPTGSPVNQTLQGGTASKPGAIPKSPNAARFNSQQPREGSVGANGYENNQGANHSKGFFSARIHQNSNLRDSEKAPESISGPGITSPRRQLQATSQQMNQQPPNANLRVQPQKSTGRTTMAQSHVGKPLSPMSDQANNPRQAQNQLGEEAQNSQQSLSGQSATTKVNSQASSDSKAFMIDEPKHDPNIQFVEVQQLLFGENPPVLNPKTLFLKNHEPTKASTKKCGVIKSYAANTNQGIIREYNEDRVSIILNILKPKSKAKLDIEWPQICFFGVFDGHGGAACADYLRDNLHNYVVQHELFPQYPIEAITQGFKDCEKNFISLVEMAQARAQSQMPGQQVGPERSGSCATVVIIINDISYVVNVGDSRCIMSIDAGSQTAVLSRDHKPDDEKERLRIQAGGGKIYRTQTFAKAAATPEEKDLYVQGPLRVFPGRLSVSRTFGDIEAKKPRYNGNPEVVVCEPEITTFKLQDNFDFFMIGCDGIFEQLTNKDIIKAIWDRIAEQTAKRQIDSLTPPQGGKGKPGMKSPRGKQEFFYDEHIAAAEGVEIGLRVTAASRSLDNITILILGLKNLKTTIKKLNEGESLSQVRRQIRAEQQQVANTYERDFMEVEINETDFDLLNDQSHSGIKVPSQQGSPVQYNKQPLKM